MSEDRNSKRTLTASLAWEDFQGRYDLPHTVKGPDGEEYLTEALFLAGYRKGVSNRPSVFAPVTGTGTEPYEGEPKRDYVD